MNKKIMLLAAGLVASMAVNAAQPEAAELTQAGAVVIPMGNEGLLDGVTHNFETKDSVLAALKHARESEEAVRLRDANMQELERKSQRSWYGALTEDYISRPVCWLASGVYSNVLTPTALWGYHVGKYGLMASGVTAIAAPYVLKENYLDTNHRNVVLAAGAVGLGAGCVFGYFDIKRSRKAQADERALAPLAVDLGRAADMVVKYSGIQTALAQTNRGLDQLREQYVQAERQAQADRQAHTELTERLAREHQDRLTEMEAARVVAEQEATRQREEQAARLQAVQVDIAQAGQELTNIKSNIAGAVVEFEKMNKALEDVKRNLSEVTLLQVIAACETKVTQAMSMTTLLAQIQTLPDSAKSHFVNQYLALRNSFGEGYRSFLECISTACGTRPDLVVQLLNTGRIRTLHEGFLSTRTALDDTARAVGINYAHAEAELVLVSQTRVQAGRDLDAAVTRQLEAAEDSPVSGGFDKASQ